MGEEQDSDFGLGVEDDEMGEEEGECVDQQDSHVNVAVEEVEMGEEDEYCDGGEEQEEVNLEEGDGGDKHDYLDEEEEGGNVVEGEVEASTAECLDDSEEERMANHDDGFGVENDRVDQLKMCLEESPTMYRAEPTTRSKQICREREKDVVKKNQAEGPWLTGAERHMHKLLEADLWCARAEHPLVEGAERYFAVRISARTPLQGR
ncbi:hypothetical protein LR48_Vigan06g056100 [Vigna angularis]|uniref:Uncharacterized protein n=1 Tax=Phaseolus angularis TaxID=3914 RepID=A0A0L9UQT6_PHAAN|nr:hypothetical protein LR48_Vigan06g056100 [Vigna angularis]